MADLCKQCSEELFGNNSKDLAELVSEPGMIDVFCDGCGYIYVNFEGKRVCYQDPKEGDDDSSYRR